MDVFLIFSGSAVEVPPKLLVTSTGAMTSESDDLSYVEVGFGEDALLPCFSSGSPAPLTR